MKSGNIRCPDVAFILKERLPEGQPPVGFGDETPDLAIGVISPSEEPKDIFAKLAEYFESGTQRVWLLKPETQKITVYWSPIDVQTFGPEDELSDEELLPGFRCCVKDLFEWD